MRVLFTLITIAVVALALFGMWWSWRARSRRDAGVGGVATTLTGEVLAHFGGGDATAGGLQYVSTTPVGEPLTRIAAPGLRYRGPAEVTVRRDGVTIEVVGEKPVSIAAEHVLGTAAAGRRVGKAVENGGLALLVWQPNRAGRTESAGRTGPSGSEGAQQLESSFRFASSDDQERFGSAIAELSHAVVDHQEGTQ